LLAGLLAAVPKRTLATQPGECQHPPDLR
jgi:hypothetical protein